jgi:spermidine/putrescine transport system permease protein
VKKGLPFWITLLTLIFLYLPILIMMGNSFNASRFGGQWHGFSLHWYQQLLHDSQVWDALIHSLIVATSATIASTILGTMAAFALHLWKGKLQKFQWGMIYSPLLLPDVLMGVALLVYFLYLNISLGLFTIFLAHTTFCISYVTLVMLSRLQNFDFSLIEAAQDLGASPAKITTKIVLPLLTPGLIAAALLAFTLSIDDFVITFFVTGPGSTTLPIFVYGMIKYGSTAIINALSTIILLVTVLLVVCTQLLTQEDKA